MIPTDSSQVRRLQLTSSGWLGAVASRLPAPSAVVPFHYLQCYSIRSAVVPLQVLECEKGYVRQQVGVQEEELRLTLEIEKLRLTLRTHSSSLFPPAPSSSLGSLTFTLESS
jgi:hypothetical protein